LEIGHGGGSALGGFADLFAQEHLPSLGIARILFIRASVTAASFLPVAHSPLLVCLFLVRKLILPQMHIQFREFNPFDVWIWLNFTTIPSQREKQYVEEVFNSWFYLGKLGAFNAENLQVQETGLDLSYMNYDSEGYDKSLLALMHNMGEFEYEGTWARCWFDLGTSDAIALDILINSLVQLSDEYVTIEQLYIGGENEDWSVEDSDSHHFTHNN
jgi:Protein of unknown function (DUF3531)